MTRIAGMIVQYKSLIVFHLHPEFYRRASVEYLYYQDHPFLSISRVTLQRCGPKMRVQSSNPDKNVALQMTVRFLLADCYRKCAQDADVDLIKQHFTNFKKSETNKKNATVTNSRQYSRIHSSVEKLLRRHLYKPRGGEFLG